MKVKFTAIQILFLFLLTVIQVKAQNQNPLIKISGKVIDAESGIPIMGASVVVIETNKGTTTDVEGRFFLQLEKGKAINLKISSVGFETRTIQNINTNENGATFEVVLSHKPDQLEQVTVQSSVRKESVNALYFVQKNSSSISDGISADVIQKSPDKNTGEVLKRVSGASVQDNKFVVIRGLSERYNSSLLNNSVLPSTEPDKKAFAFDIIPSSLIDHLVIYKTATPDLPGDFSGGAIKITTKDYPTKAINELSVSIGYNSQTTFKNFYTGFPTGKQDWLGFFDNSRLIPKSYNANKAQFINLADNQKQFVTKQFSNTYGYKAAYKSAPNISLSYKGGNTRLLSNDRKLGFLYAVAYSNGRKVSNREREEYQTYSGLDYVYNTNNYEAKNNLSALLNLTYSYRKNKISWKTLFNNDFSKTIGIRDGVNIVNGTEGKFLVKSTNSEATSNGVFNSVLEGNHGLQHNWSVDWNASYGLTYRWQPEQKILAFHTNPGATDNYLLTLSNENSPEISNAGRVYSFLKENIYGGNINLTKQFNWSGHTQKFKFGSSNYLRDRNVEVDALGYSILNSKGTNVNIPETKAGSFNNIFSPENIDAYNLTVANIPANSTSYTGTALLNAGYVMLDNKFSDKVKLTWGARVENYKQEIKAPNQKNISLNNFDVLPSFLFTYSLNSKTNLRLAGSRAVNRPEFRELAAYRVFDYDNSFIIIGEPNLKRTENTNADLRYEWFPSGGEIISASLFYKHFKNPIEQVNLGNDILSYANATNATAYGIELELRKKLDFIGPAFFNHFTFYANAAYIKGSVKFADVTINSPLQGQSPYIINSGLTYTTDNNDLSLNLLYNRIGSRLRFRAINGAGRNIFEKPRDVMDFQVAKKLFNNKLEARLTINDILAQAFQWYYKYEENPSNIHYNPATDRIVTSTQYGATTTLSLKYNF